MNIKNILFATALLVSTTLSATVEPTIVPAVKSFIVDLNDWANNEATVYITNADGNILVSDKIENQAGRIYNLKNLSDGRYTVSVNNDLKVINTALRIVNDIVIVEDTEVIYKPVITTTDEYIDVNVLTQGETVLVDITDENGEVFAREYKNTTSVNQRYSINDLPAGQYYVSVSKGNINKTMVVEK